MEAIERESDAMDARVAEARNIRPARSDNGDLSLPDHLQIRWVFPW